MTEKENNNKRSIPKCISKLNAKILKRLTKSFDKWKDTCKKLDKNVYRAAEAHFQLSTEETRLVWHWMYGPPKETKKIKQSKTIKRNLDSTEVKLLQLEIWLKGQYKIERFLGAGAFGTVALATSLPGNKSKNIPPGTKVAIKVVHDVFCHGRGAKRYLRELICLRALNKNDSLVKLLDVTIPNPCDLSGFNELILVFEFVDYSLKTILKSNNFLSPQQIKSLMYQSLQGLQDMHENKIVHRDLKPENILCNNNATDLKICDFGLARSVHETTNTPRTKHTSKLIEVTGATFGVKEISPKEKTKKYDFGKEITAWVVTRYYRAPEVSLLSIKRDNMSAIDMWSIGCIFAELLQMNKNVCSSYKHRRILFKGKFDHAFTPNDGYSEEQSQLIKILNIVGSPSQDYIDTIKDESTKEFLESYTYKGKDLSLLFKNADIDAIDLLKKLLVINPQERINVTEALKHPYFKEFQGKSNSSPNPSAVSLARVADFEDVTLTMLQLRCLIVDELLVWNKDWLKLFGDAVTKLHTNTPGFTPGLFQPRGGDFNKTNSFPKTKK